MEAMKTESYSSGYSNLRYLFLLPQHSQPVSCTVFLTISHCGLEIFSAPSRGQNQALIDVTAVHVNCLTYFCHIRKNTDYER
jgi:hypothetical protein